MLVRFLLFVFVMFIIYASFKLGKFIGRIPTGKSSPQKQKKRKNIEEAEYEEL